MKLRIFSIIMALTALFTLCFGFTACAPESESEPPPISDAGGETPAPDEGKPDDGKTDDKPDGDKTDGNDKTDDKTDDNNKTDGDKTGEDENKDMAWNDDGALKILMIGNSFSIDAIYYGYNVAKSLGVKKVYLGCMYIGGCSIATHAANAKNDIAGYEYHTNSSGDWRTTPGYTISDALQAQDWDFVTLQQVSTLSGQEDSLGDLDYLIGYVKDNLKENSKAKIVWHSTWAYSTKSNDDIFKNKYNGNQVTMYNAIVDVVKKVIVPKEDIYSVIPNGTAIQNARTVLKADLCRDDLHLDPYIGRYIAAMTLISKLTGLDVSNIKFAPFGVDDTDKAVAIQSVKDALATPYEITTHE